MSTNSWPNPERPGVPLNPEKDGWHWLRWAGEVFVAEWSVIGNCWVDAYNSGPSDSIAYTNPREMAEKGVEYLGRCLTPTEVDAFLEQARQSVLPEKVFANNAPRCMGRMDADAWALGWNSCRESMLLVKGGNQ